MKFAKVVFWTSGLWGIAVLTVLFFMLDTIGRFYPPSLTHPEFYYAFLSVTMAWQVAFLVIGADPARFRPLMIPAMLEKFGYVAASSVLFLQRHLTPAQFLSGSGDLIWGVLFVIAFWKTPRGRRDG
jgi:hypothetical protein